VSIPRFSMQYQTYAPQAKYVMFEKSGHNQFIEEPELYFKTIREFLSQSH
jgi:proline iminopeptidase